MLCLVAQLCLTLCDPMDCSLPSSSVHKDFPGKNTGVGCHALLQRMLPTQRSNPGLPHCRQILYQLSHQGSPRILEWVSLTLLQGIFPTQELNQGLLHCRATREAHILHSLLFSSVTQSCPTLCDPMNRSTPGLPVHHQFLEFTQTHVH